MNDNHWSKGKWATILGVITAILTIVVFITGKQKLEDFFPLQTTPKTNQSSIPEVTKKWDEKRAKNEPPFRGIPISNFGNCRIIAACFKESGGVNPNGESKLSVLVAVNNNGDSSAHIVLGGFQITSSSKNSYSLETARTTTYSDYPYFVERVFEFLSVKNGNGVYLNPSETVFAPHAYEFSFRGKNWAINDSYTLTGWGLCNGVEGEIRLQNLNSQSCKEYCTVNRKSCNDHASSVCAYSPSMCVGAR